MSRHKDVDSLTFNAPARFSAVEWASFLQRSQVNDLNPIDEFSSTHVGLTALGGLVGQGTIRSELEELLAGQVVLGYVSATELFMRRLLAKSVRLCPNLRKRNSAVQIPFGALDFYQREDIEHALTERVSFSEPGKVANVLRERFGIAVKPNSSMSTAIADFEGLCQLRHSLVHSRGVVNSMNAEQFELPQGRGHCVVTLDRSEIAAAGSICMNLVREVNNEVGKSVLWDWLTTGLLRGTKRVDSPKLSKFVKVFVSASDPQERRVSVCSLQDLLDTTQAVIGVLATSSAGIDKRSSKSVPVVKSTAMPAPD
ncbi:hypothetical protein OHA10_24495 [Kribbella sp. NBC_00662]|uniref:hypothetical protein n=1 Tax=Kribbella sp. NBC_00662 TaxID=2975969 RepID=UPI0032558C5D